MTRLSLPTALLVLPSLCVTTTLAAQETGDLKLRDFKPHAMLRVQVHAVEHARFPAIDVHNHVNDARGDDPPIDPLPGEPKP